MKNLKLSFLTMLVAVATPCLACLAKDAATRIWTDTTGQQTEAEFVRVHEGKVILRRGKKVMVTVPFENLSTADREYVRNELEAKGEGHLLEQF
ncbi:MAG: hypothetical protein HUU20_15920, partial [Pirellulales bacterium]|nr:hypothetical protein [Pirellulales bacterium]